MKLTENPNYKNFIIWLLVISTIQFLLFYFLIPEFSLFPAGLMKVGIVITLFYQFDKYILKGIDTLEELQKGNIAYSLFLLAIAILISSAIFSI